jgi:rhodanese-related sulfurtransferase
MPTYRELLQQVRAEISELDATDARALIETETPLVLDVREQDEWDAGHAPQARHLAMSELGGRIDEIPNDVPVICVCHGGGRSSRVAMALHRAGYNAINMRGGMVAWDAAGLPVVDHAGARGEVI